MAKNRVLMIAFGNGESPSTYQTRYRSVRAALNKLGYAVDKYVIDNTSTFGQGAEIPATYDFIVLPWVSATSFDYTSPCAGLLTGAAYVPVFALGCDIAGAGTPDMQRTCGTAYGVDTTTNYRPFTWRGNTFYAYARSVIADPTFGTDITALNSLIVTPAEFSMWRRPGSRTRVYYESTFKAAEYHMLPFLMQEAVNDGAIAAPRFRIGVTVDLDDMPDMSGGSLPNNTIDDMTQAYAVMQQYGWPIYWGLQTNIWASITAAQRQFIEERSPDKGGLIYPLNHGIGYVATSGKAALNTNIQNEFTNLDAASIPTGTGTSRNNFGFRYHAQNGLDQAGVQLSTRETDYTASPGNNVLQAGFGLKVMRLNYADGTSGKIYGHPYREVCRMESRSITMVASDNPYDPTIFSITRDTVPGALDTNRWGNLHNRIFTGALFNVILYVHGSNCYNNHDGGNNWGVTMLNDVGGLATTAKDVYRLINAAEYGRPMTRMLAA